MSTNCIRCVKNKRTGTDLLCDECRAPSALAAPTGSLTDQFPLTSEEEFGECIDFIKSEIVEAEKAVKFRDDSYKTWRGGTDNSWRQAGCYESKAARIKTSDGHGRMAIKCRKRLKLLQSTLAILMAAKEFKL